MTAEKKAQKALDGFLAEIGPSKAVERFLSGYGNVRTKAVYACELGLYFRWLKGVVVLGATSRSDIIDEALLRLGRFDRILEVPPLDKEGRVEILKIHTKKKPLASDVDLDELADMTEGYTGADLAAVANAAALAAVKEFVKTNGKEADQESGTISISMRYLEEAVRKIRSRRGGASAS